MFSALLHNSAVSKTLANREGVAAIEFALIAPIMIALYVGLAEISLLVTADRKVSHATSVTGDLATQVEALDTVEIENILQATIAVLDVNFANASYLTVDMTSYEVDSSGNTQQIGYAKLGSGLTTPFDASGINSTLLNQTSGLVVTRIVYNYRSPSREFVGTPTLSETFMLKPRKSSTIPFSNGSGSTVTCSLSQSNGATRVSCT